MHFEVRRKCPPPHLEEHQYPICLVELCTTLPRQQCPWAQCSWRSVNVGMVKQWRFTIQPDNPWSVRSVSSTQIVDAYGDWHLYINVRSVMAMLSLLTFVAKVLTVKLCCPGNPSRAFESFTVADRAPAHDLCHNLFGRITALVTTSSRLSLHSE